MAKEVNIVVRGVLRKQPDLKRLARALLRDALEEMRRREAQQDLKDLSDETSAEGNEASS
jgi:hypothetical protein